MSAPAPTAADGPAFCAGLPPFASFGGVVDGAPRPFVFGGDGATFAVWGDARAATAQLKAGAAVAAEQRR